MTKYINKTQLLFSVFFIISFFVGCHMAYASSSSGIEVNLKVGNCNNNGVCEVGQEDMISCPADCVPPPAPEENKKTGSIIVGDYFNNLSVEVSYNKAIVRWKSTVPTTSILKWGTNLDYKDGSIKNDNLVFSHKVEINDLNDGTIYYFSIQSSNYYGVLKTLDSQFFQTLTLPDTTPPDNPTNVKIVSGPSGVTISWTNPIAPDFDYIRVTRSEDRFYSDPLIGHLVYEGPGNYFTDANVTEGHKYYYVLFARDKAGNYSSGALVSIIHNPKNLDNIGQELPPSESESEIPSGVYFKIIQNSLNYDFAPGNNFKLSGDEPITIKTNYFSKIINDDLWIEIRDSDGVIIGQYFFERTRDKDNFIKVVIPSFAKGDYYHVAIYKYTYGISQLINHGSFEISKVSSLQEKSIWSYWYVFIFVIISLLLILLLIYISRKIIKKINLLKK